MATYEITAGTIKVKDGRTRFMVTFTNDKGFKSIEQFYEVHSTDEQRIYEALDAAAKGFNKGPVSAPPATTPTLTTGEALEVGVETAKAKEINQQLTP